MALSKKIMAAGLAALALAATTAAASAAPAYATGNVNVRSGPGTGYRVVDTLLRGEQVDIQYCRGSWCFVDKRGPSGWVSANYLDRGRPGNWNNRPGWNNGWNNPPPPPSWGHRPPRPPHWNPRPRPVPPNNGGSVCFNGPNGYFCVGN